MIDGPIERHTHKTAARMSTREHRKTTGGRPRECSSSILDSQRQSMRKKCVPVEGHAHMVACASRGKVNVARAYISIHQPFQPHWDLND